jgi:hypothetical protein
MKLILDKERFEGENFVRIALLISIIWLIFNLIFFIHGLTKI